MIGIPRHRLRNHAWTNSTDPEVNGECKLCGMQQKPLRKPPLYRAIQHFYRASPTAPWKTGRRVPPCPGVRPSDPDEVTELRCARMFPEPCGKPAEVSGVVSHYQWCKACFLAVNEGRETW